MGEGIDGLRGGARASKALKSMKVEHTSTVLRETWAVDEPIYACVVCGWSGAWE